MVSTFVAIGQFSFSGHVVFSNYDAVCPLKVSAVLLPTLHAFGDVNSEVGLTYYLFSLIRTFRPMHLNPSITSALSSSKKILLCSAVIVNIVYIMHN